MGFSQPSSRHHHQQLIGKSPRAKADPQKGGSATVGRLVAFLWGAPFTPLRVSLLLLLQGHRDGARWASLGRKFPIPSAGSCRRSSRSGHAGLWRRSQARKLPQTTHLDLGTERKGGSKQSKAGQWQASGRAPGRSQGGGTVAGPFIRSPWPDASALWRKEAIQPPVLWRQARAPT